MALKFKNGERVRAPTLLQVAERAGVSAATVNRVLRGGYVSDDAKGRVARALEQTGYRPNIVARGLRTSRSHSIGHVVSSIIGNPFFGVVARGFEDAAQRAGYATILVDHADDPDRELEAVHSFIQRGVDAIAFNNAMSGDAVKLAISAGLPVVEIERASTRNAPFVRVDNVAGARSAMQHLLGLGHRRIAFIGGDPKLFRHDPGRKKSVEDDRLGAYHDAMAAAGLRANPALVKLGRYTSPDARGTGSDGYRLMRELLTLRTRPTAVFATCDILAAGALQALYESGLRVPEDVSIVGFDDTLAANLTPPLTTVAQPMIELGQSAFAVLEALINETEMVAPTVLTTTLRLRASTGPIG